jgi:hypothetical protein
MVGHQRQIAARTGSEGDAAGTAGARVTAGMQKRVPPPYGGVRDNRTCHGRKADAQDGQR